MKLSSGIASEATISRMFAGVDTEMLGLIFINWVAKILDENGIHVIIDGKALKGGTEKIKGGNTPYVLNAIDAATRMVLAQLPVDSKSNEITAIPKLLEALGIESKTFTIDAIGTQKAIEELIISEGGHFVLQVKKNNPTLYDEIVSGFDTFEKEICLESEEKSPEIEKYTSSMSEYAGSEKNRERMEHRKFLACTQTSFLGCVRDDGIDYIKTVGISKQVRIPIEKDSDGNDITVSKVEFLKNGTVRKPKISSGDGIKDDVQLVGYISDLELTADELAKYKRDHWKIENNLHHVLDDVMREDRSPAKKGKFNLSLIRKIVYNILRIHAIKAGLNWGIQKLADYFSDNIHIALSYLFCGIESFY